MWIPTNSKIVNFGSLWADMYIPETTDAAKGHDDPGGTPVTLTNMNDASGEIFGRLSNNLEYIKNIFVLEDVTINVTTVTELQAALDILDLVTHIAKGKIFTIALAPGTYVWPAPASEPRGALSAHGIHGGGSLLFSVAGVTIEGEGTVIRPLIDFSNCTCDIIVGGAIILSNNLVGTSPRMVGLDNIRRVTALDLEVKNKAAGNLITSAVYCREVDFADLGLTVNAMAGLSTGVYRAIYARQNSNVYFDSGNFAIGKLTGEAIYLEKNSQVLFEDFDSCLPLGADIATLTQTTTIDSSSKILVNKVSSSGAGTYASPYVITVAWEGSTTTPALINYIIDLLPNPLDVFVKIKLPAGTMTKYVHIRDKHGCGGIELEGNTVLSAQGTTQDSIFDVADYGIKIDRCSIIILLDSLKLDGGTIAGVWATYSNKVKVDFGYVLSSTGSGTPSTGNAFFAFGSGCDMVVKECEVGVCNRNGIYAEEGAKVTCRSSSDGGGLNQPLQYGNYAVEGAIICRYNGAGYITGAAMGADYTNNGGQVFNS